MKQFAMTLFAAAMLAWLPATAQAQSYWYEDFDGYTSGTRLDNVGGWFGWDNTSSAAGTVSNTQSQSPANSIAVSNTFGNDAVHPFTGYNSGVWVLTAQQFLPSDLDGLTYFIVNNEYNHGGPHDWAIEMHMDPATDLVNEQLRDPNGTNAVPVVYDQWVEIRIVADLDNNLMQSFYNNQLVASGSWNNGSGFIEIQNIDLFAPHANAAFYDNISLVPEPASALLLLPVLGLALRRRR